MVFFASKHRVNQLPMVKKVIMYPIAYALKYMAGAVTYLADRFDEAVTFEIMSHTKFNGGLK